MGPYSRCAGDSGMGCYINLSRWWLERAGITIPVINQTLATTALPHTGTMPVHVEGRAFPLTRAERGPPPALLYGWRLTPLR